MILISKGSLSFLVVAKAPKPPQELPVKICKWRVAATSARHTSGENRQISPIANIRRDPKISNKEIQKKYANSGWQAQVRDVQLVKIGKYS